MSKYTQISREEMDEFLTERGFRPVQVPRTTELVYGKRVDAAGQVLSLRVYTTIVVGSARDCGQDAIRVVLFLRRENGDIVKLGGSKKVLRVEGWRANLAQRLASWHEYQPAGTCPKCGKELVIRRVKKGERKGEAFLGCTGFPVCKHTGEARKVA